MEDLQRDTLLYVGKTAAHFNLWEFIKGNVMVTSVDFDRLHLNLKINKAGISNIDHIIKALKNPEKKDTSEVVYHIGHFSLKNSTFSYFNQKHFQRLPKDVFNPNNLSFNKLNAVVSLNILTKDSINASLKKFTAVEKSGLTISNLTTNIFGFKKGIRLPSLKVELPNSQIQMTDIHLKYDSLGDFRRFVEKVRLSVPIEASYVTLSDIKAFVPEFKQLNTPIHFKGTINGRISSLRLHNFEAKYGKSCLLRADLDVNGLPKLSEAFIYGQINDLKLGKNDIQDFISELKAKPFVLPKTLNQLGIIHYKGNISGFLNNLVAYGNLSTDLGSISTDILLKLENKLRDLSYNGTIKTNSFQLGKLLGNKDLGNVSLNFNTKGAKKQNSSLQGTITAKITELGFKKYIYHDIQFDGKYDGKGFDGKASVTDPNINTEFTGKIDLTKSLPVFNFDLAASNVNLNALHLSEKYPGALLSFNGKMNMVGNSLDNANGTIGFDHISFANNAEVFNVNEVLFVSRIEKGYTNVTINSDFVNGVFSGNFKYSSLPSTINKIIYNYLPSLSSSEANKQVDSNPNHIDIDLKLADTEKLLKVLDFPYTIEGDSYLKGFVDEKTNRIELTGNIPLLKSPKQTIENVNLHCSNTANGLQLISRGQLRDKNSLLNVFLHATAGNDSIRTHLGWQNAEKVTNAGDFKAVTHIWKEDKHTLAQISVLPTQVIISDSIWNIHPCNIDFKADSTIHINNFKFDNHNQYVYINGVASKSQNDGISLVMNDLDIGFVLRLLKLRGITIDGKATGNVTLSSVLRQPIFEAKLNVSDLALNKKWLGNGQVSSTWDKTNQQLLANGTFLDKDKDTIVKANATYYRKADSINVIYNAHNVSVEFLTPYFESVVQNVKGYVNGQVRMFGALKKGLRFETDAFINHGQASVKVLNTTYYFNDSIHLTSKTIELRNIRIYDQEKNPGTLTAMLRHKGNFQNMVYNVLVKGRNLLGMNTKSGDNDYFYGKAYANGTVRITGDTKEAKIEVKASSQPHTKCFIQMGGPSKASDNSFIKFINKKEKIKTDTHEVKTSDNSFNVKVDLQIEATTDADMQLIVNPKEGDMIKGTGTGNLHVGFDSFTPMKLYGTYAINNGYYLFTFQNVILKEFKIDKESTISWTGDPFDGNVKIRAIYPVPAASLKDLMDADQLTSVSRTTVPVNCVLNLSEKLMKPTVHFDLELPSSDEMVKQQVKNIVNTDEMMNRQIVYLLLFNKFFSPEYLRATTNANTNNTASFLATTVSAQVNSIVSQMLNTNIISVGIDYRQNTEMNNNEYQAQFLIQPNNRWLVNGNVGYRYDSQGNARFISDFDFEYAISSSKKFWLKAYTHSIDRYQLREAKTTQGGGLMYKESFVSVEEMFKYYWRLLIGKEKNKTKNETTSNEE